MDWHKETVKKPVQDMVAVAPFQRRLRRLAAAAGYTVDVASRKSGTRRRCIFVAAPGGPRACLLQHAALLCRGFIPNKTWHDSFLSSENLRMDNYVLHLTIFRQQHTTKLWGPVLSYRHIWLSYRVHTARATQTKNRPILEIKDFVNTDKCYFTFFSITFQLFLWYG